MTAAAPHADLDAEFSSPGAGPVPWADTETVLDTAEVFWVTTVRLDGRPHVTPLLAAWVDGSLWFCTGEHERKARNLEHNAHCALTTGANSFASGLDVVVHGDAVRVTDHERLQPVADRYLVKYGDDWRFTVVDGAFSHGGHAALVFEVAPSTVFAFAKGEPFSQTRYRF